MLPLRTNATRPFVPGYAARADGDAMTTRSMAHQTAARTALTRRNMLPSCGVTGDYATTYRSICKRQASTSTAGRTDSTGILAKIGRVGILHGPYPACAVVGGNPVSAPDRCSLDATARPSPTPGASAIQLADLRRVAGDLWRSCTLARITARPYVEAHPCPQHALTDGHKRLPGVNHAPWKVGPGLAVRHQNRDRSAPRDSLPSL